MAEDEIISRSRYLNLFRIQYIESLHLFNAKIDFWNFSTYQTYKEWL